MIRTLRLILVFLLLSFTKAKAQYELEQDTIPKAIPTLSVKYFPSHLIGHFPSVVVGAEYRFNQNMAFEARYGWIQDRLVYEYDETYYRNKSGFKSSLALKVYFKDYELNGGFFPSLFNFKGEKETFIPFLATEIFYNNIQFDRQRTFMINCGDDCNYYTEVEYGLERNLFGGRFQMGFISQIFEPVFLEAAFAFGFMGFDLKADQRKPVEFEREYGYLFEENDLDTILPTVDISIKLVFQILK